MIGVHSNDGRLPRHSGLRIQLVYLMVIAFYGFGCAALETALVSDLTIRLEQPPCDLASLTRIRLYEDGGDFVVYGKMGRRKGVSGRVEAQVRMNLRYPDGCTFDETKRAFPPYLPKRRSRKSNFSVRFSGLPPAGTVIRIECPPIPVSAPAFSSLAIVFQDKESRP